MKRITSIAAAALLAFSLSAMAAESHDHGSMSCGKAASCCRMKGDSKNCKDNASCSKDAECRDRESCKAGKCASKSCDMKSDKKSGS